MAKGLVLARQLEQLAEERQDVVRTGLELLDTPAKLFLDLQGRVPLLDLEAGPEDLEQRQVRCAVAIGRALALEPRDRLTLQRLPELEQQPRLADTRLADDTHDLALPGSRALPALAEEAQLPPSTRQGTQPALHADLEAAAPRAPPRDVEDPHRLGPALDGDGPQRLGADVALHGPVRGLGHEHVAGLGERLQARRQVRRVADGGVVHAQVVADAPHDHRSGIDAEPQPEIDTQLPPDLPAIAADGLVDGEGGVDGAERVVLQRDGGAEERHQPIAEELVHRALVAMDRLGHEPQDAVHDLVHRLRLELGGQPRGIDQVAEHDADLFPLPLHRPPRGQDPIDEVLRRVGVRRLLRALVEGLATAATEARFGLVGEAARGTQALDRRAAGAAKATTGTVIDPAAKALHPGATVLLARTGVNKLWYRRADDALVGGLAPGHGQGRSSPAVFVRRPLRVLLVLPLVALIAGISGLLLVTALPWYVTVLAVLVLANAYVALMFFGHEVGHGATVRSQRLQDIVMWFSCAIFVVSSHLWRHWHNRLHHGRTNVPGVDPDRYDLIEDLESSPAVVRWFTTRFAPGSGHWLSAFYPFVTFTIQGQAVLWLYSRRRPSPGFTWLRAVAETAVVAASWIGLGVAIGPGGALLIIVAPMLLANAIVMAYITTNHMLRPLTDAPECLATTMSVTTLRAIDADPPALQPPRRAPPLPVDEPQALPTRAREPPAPRRESVPGPLPLRVRCSPCTRPRATTRRTTS